MNPFKPMPTEYQMNVGNATNLVLQICTKSATMLSIFLPQQAALNYIEMWQAGRLSGLQKGITADGHHYAFDPSVIIHMYAAPAQPQPNTPRR